MGSHGAQLQNGFSLAQRAAGLAGRAAGLAGLAAQHKTT